MTDYKNVTLDTDELGIWLVEEGVDGYLTQQMGFISWKDVARGVQNALLQDKMMLALQEMGQEFDNGEARGVTQEDVGMAARIAELEAAALKYLADEGQRCEHIEAAQKRAWNAALEAAELNLRAYAPHLVDGPENDVGYYHGYHTAINRIRELMKKEGEDE